MVSYHLLSNCGNRENNEDSVGMYQVEENFCFALADGLGGHGKGERASEIAVKEAVVEFAANGMGENAMASAFVKAQQEILREQKKDATAMDMKTTLVLLHVEENQIRWGHIGDSRLYYFQNGKLVKHTLDHSVPQMLVASGQLKEKQIRNHPDRNRLLRVLGVDWDSPKYQIAEAEPRIKHQEFLLCSDGFWELIDERKMVHCLKKAKTPEEWIDLMEVIVRKNGQGTNMDNYSAIAVWVD